ncbi:hypothetical protein ARSQ2_01160 [Arsenophonus endosymbiont of Bemisia tabaci Q2]|nr:hypothetical protein ARSQ2_01160 [Arsenophonus endosymbiont of Bemisia tabaci Q2]
MKIKLNYQAAIKVPLLAAVVLLAGCVSIPESIKGLRERHKHRLKVYQQCARTLTFILVKKGALAVR